MKRMTYRICNEKPFALEKSREKDKNRKSVGENLGSRKIARNGDFGTINTLLIIGEKQVFGTI